jgi:hypothetical protein
MKLSSVRPVRTQSPTLNEEFREWLAAFAHGTAQPVRAAAKTDSVSRAFREWLNSRHTAEEDVQDFDNAMEHLSNADLGGPYTREQMHER